MALPRDSAGVLSSGGTASEVFTSHASSVAKPRGAGPSPFKTQVTPFAGCTCGTYRSPPRAWWFLEPRSVFVPGGRCEFCKKRRNQDWGTRILLEYELSDKTWFGTFTYRNEKYFQYSDFQKMLKRLRKNTGKVVRYFSVEERGDKRGRWHFHAVLYGQLTKRELEREWKQGFTGFELVRSPVGLAYYLSKYVTKQNYKKRCSNEFGMRYLVERHFMCKPERLWFDREYQHVYLEKSQEVRRIPYDMQRRLKVSTASEIADCSHLTQPIPF